MTPSFVPWAALFSLSSARHVENLDQGWRFFREPSVPRSCRLPRRLVGRCRGLAPQGRPEDGAPGSAAACRAACCRDPDCNAWQWCGEDCASPNSCWKGLIDIEKNCSSSGHWEGEGDDTRRPEPEPLPGSPCRVRQCQQVFEDASWRQLDIPHDFVLEGNYTPAADKSHGYLPYGVAWYRRKLCLPDADAILDGRKVSWLEFEGVAVKWKAWLNGAYLGGHFSGYTPKLLDIRAAPLQGDCSNVLALHVDARAPDGWWYDGGGIYRHVWLTIAPAVHLVPWGVYAPSQLAQIHGHFADAEVLPEVEVKNSLDSEERIRLRYTLTSPSGLILQQDFYGRLGPKQSKNFQLPAMALRAQLWSPATPHLYDFSVQLLQEEADEVKLRIGMREIHWSPSDGFSINGVATKILGTANHQDFAMLGVAVPDELQAYRLKKLQHLGANAWRTAHNPPNEALLKAADELGVLVWDENHRNGQDGEMEAMIKRDRNHPSIVVWSICNERLCETGDVWADAKRLKAIAQRLDPRMGRVVSANYNEFNGNSTPMDLMGFDYGPEMYDTWHRQAPFKPAVSSETSSAYSDRGVVQNDPQAGHVRDYDTEHPSWGQTAEVAWQAILARPWLSGGFTWTGWDYRGEPTPYAWPDVNSHFGILDAAGFWKHRAHWYHACWTAPSEPVLHLLPHWNWPSNRSDMLVEVWAYSNLDEVELIHPNGSSLGRRSCRCRHGAWQVPFMPGTLRAYGYLAGRQVYQTQLRTTGPASALRLSLELRMTKMSLITVEVVDDEGQVVPTSNDLVTFQAEGPKLSSSGDPSDPAPPTSAARRAFGGRLRALASGPRLRATAPKLRPAELNLAVEARLV